jgi:hypothetical protein
VGVCLQEPQWSRWLLKIIPESAEEFCAPQSDAWGYVSHFQAQNIDMLLIDDGNDASLYNKLEI